MRISRRSYIYAKFYRYAEQREKWPIKSWSGKKIQIETNGRKLASLIITSSDACGTLKNKYYEFYNLLSWCSDAWTQAVAETIRNARKTENYKTIPSSREPRTANRNSAIKNDFINHREGKILLTGTLHRCGILNRICNKRQQFF